MLAKFGRYGLSPKYMPGGKTKRSGGIMLINDVKRYQIDLNACRIVKLGYQQQMIESVICQHRIGNVRCVCYGY